MINTPTWKSLATIIHVANAVFYHAKRLDKIYPAIHESNNIRVIIINPDRHPDMIETLLTGT